MTGTHNNNHVNNEFHHHHSHAENSAHPGHHHLLNVEGLSISFRMYDDSEPFFKAKQREVEVIRDLNISVHKGEILAIVGASGSGKTLLADSIMGLFEPNALVKGKIFFDGEEMDEQSLAKVRGNGISLVPQSVANLDPVMKVGRQIKGFHHRNAVGPRLRRGPGRNKLRPYDKPACWRRGAIYCARDGEAGENAQSDADVRMRELFDRYRLDESVASMYPFELSGGMLRRVLLCCALMEDPKLIVADEPTPGLDLELAVRAMEDFREYADGGGAVLLITHDIEMALRVADRIAIFKDGTVVEETAVANFASPDLLRSQFAKDLWNALPEHGFSAKAKVATC